MYKKRLLIAALFAGFFMAGTANAKPVRPASPVAPTPVTRTIGLDSLEFYAPYTDVADVLMDKGDGNINEQYVPKVAEGEAPWYALSSGGKWFSICGIKSCGEDLEHSIKVKQTSAEGQNAAGTFSISSKIWDLFSDIAIALKFGGTDKATPDWALFNIADGAKSGIWFTDAKYDFSHFTVFAKCKDSTPPNEVPLPGAAWMMLIGLTGFLGLQRKKGALTA